MTTSWPSLIFQLPLRSIVPCCARTLRKQQTAMAATSIANVALVTNADMGLTALADKPFVSFIAFLSYRSQDYSRRSERSHVMWLLFQDVPPQSLDVRLTDR